jgi:ribosomal protein L3 glutamine methyltransferase
MIDTLFLIAHIIGKRKSTKLRIELDTQVIVEAITELRTLRDLLRWSMSQFNAANLYYGHGTDNAWDEALQLISHSLHLPFDVIPQVLDSRLTRNERRVITEWVEKRITQRIPAAYLTQQAWFAGLPFYVDQRVLIPRSPIAELIEKQFVPWLEPDHVQCILDIGTGGGCIAIACAFAFPEARIEAVDISEEALIVARLNAERHHVQQQVVFWQSNLFSALPAKCQFDLIISNPPYVGAEELATLPPEYYHEPQLGLLSAENGLAIVENILQQASAYLSPHGTLIVEVGNSETLLAERYPQIPFTWLEFERGGGGVFLLTAEQLQKYAAVFKQPTK